LVEAYRQFAADHPAVSRTRAYEEMPLTDEIVTAAAVNSDKAIIIISRLGGSAIEGADDFVLRAGDYYLSEVEQDMVIKVTAHFDQVIVLLNVGNLIDMAWIEDYPVDAVLLTMLPGMEMGHAIADILTGKVNPSGKLVDTIARNYEDYPTAGNMGYLDYGDLYPGIYDRDDLKNVIGWDYENGIPPVLVYEEDIYVGYRYFETFGVEPLYPFGYGLSYTTFELSNQSASVQDDQVVVTVTVTNMGDVAGQEVVQVYIAAPNGELEKPARELKAFTKTQLLEPGASEDITLPFDLDDMASYSETRAAYIMEAGTYNFFVGNSIANVTLAGSYDMLDTTVTQQLANKLGTDMEIDRLNQEGYEDPVPAPNQFTPEILEPSQAPAQETYDYQLEDVYNATISMDEFLAQMSTETLVDLLHGGSGRLPANYDPQQEVVGDQASLVYGAAGQTVGNSLYGIPPTVMADGPAGLKVTQEVVDEATGEVLGYQNATQFPNMALLASSWDVELLERVGEAIGAEYNYYNVDMWLAPGVNNHRTPLGRRNYEYYSEDPVVTGTMAAAVVRGVQSQGVGATIKHFAGNSQDIERKTLTIFASERALREIELKAFEIAIELSDPWAVMTSYSRLNGAGSAENPGLLTEILRDEWGFDGVVMTDWTQLGDIRKQLLSQLDLNMPMFQNNVETGESVRVDILEGIEQGYTEYGMTLSRAYAERSVRNILNYVLKTNSFRERILQE